MVQIEPALEANLLTYIVLYDFCKKSCRKHIGKAIQLYGKPTRKTVYRGHSSNATRIRQKGYSFVSTTPLKRMAELFVERNWTKPPSQQRIGHLFTIHLMDIPTLSTRDIDYRLTPDVIAELKKRIRDKPIEKGNGTYTLDQYIPKLRSALKDLVFQNKEATGEELLVPTDGVFYKDPERKQKGFRVLPKGNFETWYFPKA